jgi:cation diffusion facilitator CzcD-associated flavoprotein CzcO
VNSETLTKTPGPGPDPAEPERIDVLIVGAGISGIGAAHHLQERCPGKSFAILEAREAIGGTWDLFRYPGIRSDSDMHTLGYRFRPWTAAKSIADGESILEYVRETAREAGIDRKVRFGHRALHASWSSEEARWTVTAERDDGATVTISCAFLMNCTGYYRYDQGYMPEFEGIEDFGGRVIHPQHWPEEPEYEGKRVVVIGSGATAVTLVPAMAKDAAHVTMLQRSPTYIVSVPGEDPIAELLRKFLPNRAVYPIVRWKNVAIQSFFYRLSRNRPRFMKKLIRKGVINSLPEGYDIDTHFKPKYNPWDQRVCLVPDSDLFEVLSDGSADIVTDRIERFTPNGIKLESGRELEADVVVTATGLNLLFFGGMKVEIDGVEPEQGHLLTYKGMMLGDVPNLAFTIGYTNASWTLKADLVAEFMCRLLNHMDANGYDICMPHLSDPSVTEEPILDFSSGYVVRAIADLPKQGSKEPWKLRQNYAVDLRALRYGSLEDGAMTFSRKVRAPEKVPA